MNIGILGGGNIGGALGRLWAAAGHRVYFGSRTPDRLAALVGLAGENAQAGTLEGAAAFGDTVLEAVPFHAVPTLPSELLRGKVVLTASNYYPGRDGQIDLGRDSQSEWVARHLPGARVVKAFNMMRATVMEDLAAGRATPGLAILLAGDDADAKAVAAALVRDAGFEPVDAGPLAAGRAFQAPDAPLYDVQLRADEARARLQRG